MLREKPDSSLSKSPSSSVGDAGLELLFLMATPALSTFHTTVCPLGAVCRDGRTGQTRRRCASRGGPGWDGAASPGWVLVREHGHLSSGSRVAVAPLLVIHRAGMATRPPQSLGSRGRRVGARGCIRGMDFRSLSIFGVCLCISHLLLNGPGLVSGGLLFLKGVLMPYLFQGPPSGRFS